MKSGKVLNYSISLFFIFYFKIPKHRMVNNYGSFTYCSLYFKLCIVVNYLLCIFIFVNILIVKQIINEGLFILGPVDIGSILENRCNKSNSELLSFDQFYLNLRIWDKF